MLVTVERDGPVAVVTMNRPEAMNALSRGLRAQLAQVMKELDGEERIRAVVLTGAGTRAFTAGLDLKELGVEGLGAANASEALANPVKAIEQCRKPVIGAINGVAITGGFEVALACDILIGSENARFADTHARVGIMPGWGLSQKLARMIGISRAKELSLSGNFLDAQTACAWGLLNRVVPADELLGAAKQLAADIATADPGMVQAYKALIDEGYALSFGEGMALENARSTAANSQVDKEEVEARRLAVMERGREQKG
ncbi:enoyl-CoA hydratase [Novosphingobium sp.]|uniref:enoyl-CoA hydratase n=1 Tax=Novosphingobium sp. TaxID=1874826 RepID=UPI001EB387D3|nr:enoyl-CoA hydratase [Novosphingobium sp.]MBK6803078.1 enoyl-CoA hydratase [Novosphingobium sp.]MBK9012073.1 enoyl-CoA hydratase [Novosphingobium sp.]